MSDVEQFVKLPVQIEAMQWDGSGECLQDLLIWAGYDIQILNGNLVVVTLEDGVDESGRPIAKHVASIGDWVIKGVAGEFYFCKPDIFEKSYRKVMHNERTVHLRQDGLLWYINRCLLHAHGFALGWDEETNEFEMYGDGIEPWQYADGVDEEVLKGRLDKMLKRIASLAESK